MLRFWSSVACIAILVSCLLNVAWGYDDLRERACKATPLNLKKIPEENVEWYGEMSLRLICQPGFDHPYNFNPDKDSDTITCKGKTNLWEPDFLPDCNKEVIPNATDQCPEGSVSVKLDGGRSSKCRGCPIGQFLDTSKPEAVCTPCAKGYYQDMPMSPNCKKCLSLVNVTSKMVWDKVHRLTKNRLFSIYGCPVVRKSPNGTHSVFASPESFSDEMTEFLQSRDLKIDASQGSNTNTNTMNYVQTWNIWNNIVLITVVIRGVDMIM